MTPKQRREQDILKRKTSDINKKYPQMAEPLSEMKGAVSDKERDAIRETMNGPYEADTESSNIPLSEMRGPMSDKEGEYIRNMMNQNSKMKKGGMTKSQKKIGTVMREFKKGKLHSGKKGPIVKNPKQAIAIALSEAGKSKMKKKGGGIATAGMGAALQKGGMVRGQGIALRGTKFKGVF
jgi:hypothetical protein